MLAKSLVLALVGTALSVHVIPARVAAQPAATSLTPTWSARWRRRPTSAPTAAVPSTTSATTPTSRPPSPAAGAGAGGARRGVAPHTSAHDMTRREVQVAAEWSDTNGTVTFTPWGQCTLASLLADLDVHPRVAMQVLRHARFSVTTRRSRPRPPAKRSSVSGTLSMADRCCKSCCTGSRKATPINGKWPLTCVGDTGIEPVTSSV
jgi:hypothetical protein